MPLGAFRINTLAKVQAVAAAPDITQAVYFDGGASSDTLRRSGSLASDSANFLFSGWIYHDTADTEERTYMVSGIQSGSKVIAFTSLTGSGDGKFYIYLRNSSGTTILQIQTSQSVWDGKWHHIMASWNGTTAHLYVDGVSDKVENTNTSGQNINWSCSDWAVGSNRYDGLEGGPVHTAEIYCTNEYLDLSSSANRDKFFDSTNKTPVSLGTDGSTPTGTQPLIYFSGDASVWNAGTNFGSTSGWSMALGSVTDSGQEPIVLSEPGLAAVDMNSSLGLNGGVITNTATAGDITLSFWFKWPSANTSNFTVFRPIDYFGGGLSFGNPLLQVDLYQGRLRLVAYKNDARVFDELGTTMSFGTGIYDGNWHHLVFSHDGATYGDFHVYMDGADYSGSLSTNAPGTLGTWSTTTFGWNEYTQIKIAEGGSTASFDTRGTKTSLHLAQFFADDKYYDISNATTRQKFYNGGAVDMGTDGTASGLTQPLIYHYGDTSTFLTNNGRTGVLDYEDYVEDSANGRGWEGTGIDISTSNGPQF